MQERLRITIEVGTARVGEPAARGYVGKTSKTVTARSIDAAFKRLDKELGKRGLRAVGFAKVHTS